MTAMTTMATKKKQLSPKQREMLARALAGEDRQLPEKLDPGPPSFVVPARRWYVPPGLLVPSGSVEYQAARALRAKGLLKSGGVGPSPELPYGQGGYLITPKGRKALVDIHRAEEKARAVDAIDRAFKRKEASR